MVIMIKAESRDIIYVCMGTMAMMTPAAATAFVEAARGLESKNDGIEGFLLSPNVCVCILFFTVSVMYQHI